MIVWVPCGPRLLASARFYAYRTHEILANRGYASMVFRSPSKTQHDLTEAECRRLVRLTAEGKGPHLIVFQKVWGPRALDAAQSLKRRGHWILYAGSNLRRDQAMAIEAHACIASSEIIRNELAKYCPDVVVAPEPVDCWVPPGTRSFRESPIRRLCWIGSEANQATLDRFLPIEAAKRRGVEVKVISQGKRASVQYDPTRLVEHCADCDVMLVTASINPEASPNRIIQGWALGLPVIVDMAHPYSQIIKNGVDGYLARDWKEFAHVVDTLRDPFKRFRIAEAGFTKANRDFNDEAIGDWWQHYLNARGWSRVLRRSQCRLAIRPSWMETHRLRDVMRRIHALLQPRRKSERQ
ncbi:MAG: hypothetical protein KatS3mg005_1262 [Bryobacteraceae bacterium]|nr:MAG: hypothetical protein KatS3mg005_1262 [Bryobacteraceae bacterium]